MRKVGLVSLGCAKNRVDSENMLGMLRERGYALGNADVTIILQRPRLAPHIPAMRQCIADAAGVDVDAVSVKATTEEKLGFTGASEGVAAHAVVLLEETARITKL